METFKENYSEGRG